MTQHTPSPKIVSGSDYINLPSTPSTWLIEPLLPASGAMLLYGESKGGKSFAALQLAESVQSGTPWFGFPTRKGTVVYIQLDTPRNVWQDRIGKLVRCQAMTALPYFADRETLDAWPFDILNPDHLVMLRDALQTISPDLVVIDTLRESHSGDENDSTEMQQVIAGLVAATKPAAFAVISHSRKPNQDDGFSLMNDNRGSSYVVGRMDAIVRFTPKTVRISGRSIEEHSLDVERLDSGFWEVNDLAMTKAVDDIIIDHTVTSIRMKAKLLAERIGKSEASCRGLIRRRIAAHPLGIFKPGEKPLATLQMS